MPRATTVAWTRKTTTALAMGLCVIAWLAPTADAKRPHATTPRVAAPLGGVNAGGLNFGSTPAQADEAIAEARAVRAKLTRAIVPWAALQPNGANQFSPTALAYLDRLVSDATAANIRIIMSVESSPCWASSAPASLHAACEPGHESAATAWPPSNPADYAAIVGYLTQRYGTHLAAIEVWTEPDYVTEQWLAGPEKARHYAAILRAAYPAIKRANPSVLVLAGSLVGSNGAFLRALYGAGIKGFYDGLAVHYYNLSLGALRSIHEVQIANGDTAPVWLDEFGWSSCWPRYVIQFEQACVTPGVQATNILNVFRSLAHTRFVAALLIFDPQDDASGQFGVLDAHGGRKPAFFALARALSSPLALGSPSPVTLSLHRRGSRVLASGSGPVGDFMQLEVLKGRMVRYRSLFVLDRFNRYSITLPAALGTHRLSVRVYRFWDGASTAARAGI